MRGGVEALRGNARFEVGEQLGAGGMGVVYRAYDRERGHDVALKTLEAAEGDALYRFKHEFRAIAELSHPNLVTLYDLFVDEGAAFFTMELIDGADFVAWCCGKLAESGDTDVDGTTEANHWSQPTELANEATMVPELPYDEERLRAALPQLVRGLGALHATGRVHRDIKPTNVMVGRDGRVIVLDFGLVTGEGTIGQTRQQIVGTLEYMAPEQAHPLGRVTPAADIYGAGVMLYEALTGIMPFAGSAADILMAKRSVEPAPPRALNPAIPEDLDRVCVGMMQRDPARRPSAARLLSRLGDDSEHHRSSVRLPVVRREGTFFGRAAELATMDTVFESMRAGKPEIVRLRGPSGIGKTELFTQFVERARHKVPDLVVLQGRCYERESLRYRGIDPLVDELSRTWISLPVARARALVPPRPDALLKLFPVLSRVAYVVEAQSHTTIVDPNEVRRRAFDALRQLLCRLAEDSPLVLFLDDLQWVDRDTVLLLADVMRMPGAPKLMLVLADRDEPSVAANPHLESLLDALSLEVREIELGPLSRIESVELAQRLLEPHRRSLAQLVARESTGHPLFLVELAHFVNAGGDDRGDSIYQIKLDDVIALRMRDLPPDAQAILEAVAVAGEPVPQSVLRTAVGLDSEPFARALMQLLAQRLVRTGSSDADALVEAYHDRIRATVVARLDDRARTELHRNLALALERATGSAAHGELARHWLASGEPRRALVYALNAARESFDQLDFERSVALYRLALSTGEVSAEEEREVHEVIGAALAAAGRARDAAEAYRQAAEGESHHRRLDLERRAAEQLLRGGHIDEGLEAFGALLDEIGLAMPSSRGAALRSILWLRARLRLGGLRYRLRDVDRNDPGVASELLTVDICWSLATSLSPLDPVAGMVFHLRGLRAALRLGERRRLGRALAWHAMLAAVEGDRRADKRRALTREVAQDDPYVAGYALIAEAANHFFVQTDWKRVVDRHEEMRDLFTSEVASGGWEIDMVRLFQLISLMYLGELDEVTRLIDDSGLEEQRRRARPAAQAVRARMVLPWLVLDDPDGASADLVALADEVPGWKQGFTVTHFYALQSRCEVELYRGDAELAGKRQAQFADSMKESMLLRIPIVRTEWIFLSARIALARGDAARARKEAAQIEKCGLPVARHLAGLVRAAATASAGDSAAAERQLRAAMTELEDHQTMLYATPARYRLGELVGGTEGEVLRAAAVADFADQGVARPEALFDLLLPWPSKSD